MARRSSFGRHQRPITFLTDFGYVDEFAGVCRVVINRIDAGIPVIDLTHGIPAGDVRRGATALAAAAEWSGPAVHLAVVDPGVGTGRRALLLVAGKHHLVGPDNGLLLPSAERLGGVDAAFEITNSPARISSDYRTFDGRDLFSPVAARLAVGAAPAVLGEPVDPASLIRPEIPRAEVSGEGSRAVIRAHVLFTDDFGNLVLDADSDLIESSFLESGRGCRLEFSRSDHPGIEVVFAATFGEVDPGEAVLYPDSSGTLALAVNRGDAAKRFRLGPDDEILITPVAAPE